MQLVVRKSLSNIIVGVAFFGIFYLGLALTLGVGFWVTLSLLEGWIHDPDLAAKNQSLYKMLVVLLPIFRNTVYPGVFIVYMVRSLLYLESKRQPGPLLQPGQCPELGKLVSQVAAVLEVSVPQDIYLLADPQAAAHEFTLFAGSKEVLLIGWPLILVLSRLELQAVIAHELAHFDSRAFFLHHAIWRIGSLMDEARSIHDSKMKKMDFSLWNVLWDLPVVVALALYLRIFLPAYSRLTRNIQYEFELYCDNRSAQAYGSNILVSAIEKVMKLQVAFDDYVRRASGESVQRFFDDFLNHYSLLEGTDTLNNALAETIYVSSTSHPSLAQRQEAMSVFPRRTDTTMPIITDWDQIHAIGQDILKHAGVVSR